MSVLAGLIKVHNRLSVHGLMAPEGYSAQSIQGFVVLNEDGEIVGSPQPWGMEKKRLISKTIDVPYFGGRSGQKAPPYFLWDNTAYVFGVTKKEGFDAVKRFEAFKAYHLRILSEAADPGLIAVTRFLERWRPEFYVKRNYSEHLLDRNVVFRLKAAQNLIHECGEAANIWQQVNLPDTVGKGFCLVTGETAQVARIHPPIKSFENPARLVSFDKDNDAFSSYGHEQAANAPTGIAAAFAYTAVLNRFLATDSGHRVQVGDTSTVFWADASNMDTARRSESFFAAFVEASGSADDTEQARKVGDKLEAIRQGRPLREVEPTLAEGVRFHVLGLAPNAARLSVRFHLEDEFGEIAANYQRFLSDIAIEPAPRGPIAFWRLLAELAVQGKRENVSPGLAGDWMRAVLSGGRYPAALLAAALMRVRADQSVTALRAGILRAMLVRNRSEEAPMARDVDNEHLAYQLGRLFAVLEAAQYAALGRVNASIADRYYASASSTPARVFAPLLRGLRVHISDARKRGRGGWIEPRVAEIMGRLPPDLPTSLRAVDQGRFAIGYYHEKSHRPAKAEDDAPLIEESEADV